MADQRHLVLRADDILAFQVPHAEYYLSQEILCSENTGLHDGFLNRGTLRPHSAIGGGAHPKHDEIYYVLSGHGTIRLGGDPTSGDGAEVFRVEEGSVVYIPANTFHALRNDSDHDVVFLTIWPQATRAGDNDVHDERVRVWGAAFRLRDGCAQHQTQQGTFVTDRARGWNPLVDTP
ncbi:MAG: cupin domain-containing protein [Chloroflexi bacterium]|nr:cupin domain-containing protein [Chloroflexota bacterium]MBV9601262.1 cupin domain-containing protein [Chloroflexota bacterium]